MGENPDTKSQLVIEICSISSRSISCVHHGCHPRKPTFIDWYLLLQVDENAGIDVIRKQYRRLALLLHPDKNRHPKAEIAFKLVSEAYACLSDKAKRRTFNFERRNSLCKECNRKCQSGTEQARSYKVVQALREVSNRFKQETKVIVNCLRAHAASRKEFPIFDPSAYVRFPNCPNHRIQILKKKNSNDFLELWVGNITNSSCRRGTSCESPVYEIGLHFKPIGTEAPCFGTQYRRPEIWQSRAA